MSGAAERGKEVKVVLVESGSGRDALRKLFQLRKRQDARFTLSTFARRVGIASKGHASEIVNGRRKLPVKYRRAAASALGLAGHAARYFLGLFALEDAGDGEGRAAVLDELLRLRKILEGDVGALPSRLRRCLFALEVYAALSIFGNAATHQQLLRFFGRERIVDLEQALRHLVAEKLLAHRAGVFTNGPQASALLLFGEDPDGGHLAFLQSSLADASDNLARWFVRRDVACLRSSILSVRRRDYERRLAAFREDLVQMQSDLESPDADMLVRINVQAYPIGGIEG